MYALQLKYFNDEQVALLEALRGVQTRTPEQQQELFVRFASTADKFPRVSKESSYEYSFTYELYTYSYIIK